MYLLSVLVEELDDNPRHLEESLSDLLGQGGESLHLSRPEETATLAPYRLTVTVPVITDKTHDQGIVQEAKEYLTDYYRYPQVSVHIIISFLTCIAEIYELNYKNRVTSILT